MTGFVSSPPPSSSATILGADGWWPDIDLAHLRDTMRLGTVVTDDRLTEAAIGAMISVRRDLRTWKLARVLDGAATLADVPAEPLAGVSELVLLWRRAVYNHACADLCETYRDLSATSDGSDRAEARALGADDYRRNALFAVRDMLAVGRVAVELI
ncbi:head completion/stabilization protein [Flavisphingomonas formosensis]|uniref:head completion/stabilization protein n=1 Tax=Flavisphingomonas formosensis TaxID=861534 RepID=UPI0018E0442F|nr:head completion/stabilization protein [Sphingomonas formosensis]